MSNKDFHSKPTSKERHVEEALSHAEKNRIELPKTVQVSASDWDLVILADEVERLRWFEEFFDRLMRDAGMGKYAKKRN